MASSASEEAGTGRSLEGVSNGQQRCQSSEALAEWRSSEQLENGTPSTSPPYWDSDDDEDAGPKPSELYGKYTWKIDKFSQINKRELRSNAFVVGGFKWYILIYPQGCDVCNHLSLFLCVANHDKLLPGWSHFAQFTIAVVNKDPKKSKYSDTLHRFWKKEHDWGWKKFMELSKVLEGFIDADTLIIKAQVQVIRERADRPFRCLDCQYRRELVRVYLTNVEQICRRFVEERRGRLGKLIEDKARWSSFCAFWLGMDQNSRCRMSREKSDSILKVIVKHFFIEKEVTSTLVMDSLYSGLKAIEGQTKGKKGKGKYLDAEEQLVPIVRLDEDMFFLVDDVLQLLERAALETLPPKDEKGPQNRTKDGTPGEDFNKDSIVRDERRLTELGRRTIEIFVLAHIFSKIEVAYQEAVALKRQEELIREEEASWLAETELKAKKASDKEKKSKKKQGKQKKNNRKTKDKGRDEKICIIEHEKAERDGCFGDGNDYETEEPEAALEKTDILEDVSDISDSVDCVPEVNHPDFEDRRASPVNWDTDTSEMHPSTETSCSGLSGLSSVQNGISGKSLSVMDDSSSTCSTDSVPSAATNSPYRGTSNHKNQKSPSRVANHRSKSTSNAADCASETHSQPVHALPDAGRLSNTAVSCGPTRSVSQAIAHLHEQEMVKKKIVVSQQRKLTEADTERPPWEKPHVMSPPRTPPKSAASAVQSKSELKVSATSDPNSVKRLSLESPKLTHKSTTLANSAETAVLSKADPHKVLERHAAEKPSVHSVSITPQNFQSRQATSSATTEKPKSQASALSRPLSAPVVPGPRPATPVVSMVPASPVLARSVSAAGQLGSDPSPATHSYVPQSYRNAIVGNPVSGSSAGFSQPYSPSPVVNSSQPYPQSPSLISGPSFLPQGSERIEPSCIRPSFSYGMMNHDTLQNGLQFESSQRDSRSISRDHASMISEFQNFDLFKPVNSRSHDHIPSEFPACTSGRQSQSALADEFPHLDIINDLLDDEHGIGRTSMPNTGFHQSYNNGSHHLNRHFSFPGDIGMPAADLGPSTSSCRFERTRSYHDEIQHNYSGGPFDSVSRDMIRQPNPQFISGQIDGLVPNQWQMMGSDPSFLGMRNVENDPSLGGSRRHSSDTASEKGSLSQAQSRASSPSKHVARCQSFAERPLAQPLPLPGLRPANVGRSDSGISASAKSRVEKGSKQSLFPPLPKPACIRHRLDPADTDGELVFASVSSECSIESDDPTDSRQRSPLASDYETGSRTAIGSPSSLIVKDQSAAGQISLKETTGPVSLSPSKNVSSVSPKRRPLSSHVTSIQVPPHGAFCSAPDSSMSSPSRSPMRIAGSEQVTSSTLWAGRAYPDLPSLGSGHCSSPGSGQNSGHNSMGGDMSGQLFWQPCRGSPEYSPIPSPRMTSPGPSSRIHSGAVTPIHPRAVGGASELQSSWPDDGKPQSHPLPLPPLTISNSSPFSHSNSVATSPSVPRSPGRAENLASLGSRWKKGKLLGRGTFGHVYVGFNSDSGEMCAMKEVTLFSDDAKSKESAKQLAQEIALLSRLRHPNIVQYYGTETVGDKLYIYLEYVSGGSIYKLLQEYGAFGETAIRSYTQQILSGLAYLHAKNTVHRDIKGANILVDPNGRIKLADFGMAKHITGQSCPLSFKGSPYWMAPEVIKNSSGCNLAVDIWSLGCTVLEMATSKPPFSQYEGVAAMFKIGNSKELPAIPEHLSDEGKDFVRKCLQREPRHRPTAALLLEHPFVKNAATLEKPNVSPASSDPPYAGINGAKSQGTGQARNSPTSESERLAIHSSRVSKSNFHCSDIHITRNISCPVSPIGSPLLHPRSPQQLNGRMSPSPISSPITMSGSSTPLSGGTGAIPFHHLNQSVYLQEAAQLPQSPYMNGPSYWDPDVLRGTPSGSHAFRELASSQNDALGKQFGRPTTGEFFDGQSVLANRVSQQLLRDHVKLVPSLDLNPCPPLEGRTGEA